MRIKTYAKLNLYLKVFPLRTDGFHNLVSVMQTIDLADEMVFIRKGESFKIECDHPGVPNDERNVVSKIYHLLKDEYPDLVSGVEVKLRKRIPIASGLAGGSGNAAGALVAFSKLFDIPLDERHMVKLGSQAGSDVPFMLLGGCALVRGRGEIIEKLPGVAGVHYLVVTSKHGVDTADAYRLLDEWRADKAHKIGSPHEVYPEARSAWLSALASGQFETLLHNDFEDAIFASHPEIAMVKEDLNKSGVPAYMTGSGSAVFAPVSDYSRALKLLEGLRGTYGEAVYLCQPIDKGVEIID